MIKEEVYAYLKRNKSILDDRLSRLATDLIEIGSIPLEPVLIGDRTNWRLMSNDDVKSMVSVNEQCLSFIAEYDIDPTQTLAYLKYGD